MKFFFDNLVNVSDQPFQLLTVFNLALTIIFLFRVIIDNYISFKILPEITSGFLLSIISAIFFIEFALLSIIGEICIRNLREAQKNPIFIIKNIYNKFKVDTN